MDRQKQSGQGQLVYLLRRQWRVIALTVLVVTGLMTAYAELLPSEYESTAVLAITPRQRSGADAEMVRVGAAKYVAYATAGATERAVAQQLRERPEVLSAKVDAEAPLNTGNIIITARFPSPERAAAAANAFADSVGRFSASDRLLTAQVVAHAVPPSAPSGPPRRLIELTAALAGLMLGWGLAAVREAWRKPAPRAAGGGWPQAAVHAEASASTGTRAEREPPWGVISRIPWSSGLQSAADSGDVDDPDVLAAARKLRGNLLQAVGNNLKGTAVLVTSPVSKEGKTTVARLLSLAFTETSYGVLLVHDGHGPDAWAVDAAPEGESLDGAVQAGPVPGLWVLPSMSSSNGNRSWFRKLDWMVNEARERFDLVVIDGPPLVAADKFAMFSRLADGVLLVFSSTTLFDDLEEAMARLGELEVPVLSVVANGFGGVGDEDEDSSNPQRDASVSYNS